MPIVAIKVTREGTATGAVSVTPGQKAALTKGASQLLLDLLN
jgi:4-oxalocrotonate tautomerase